ncbi:MAG TPA: hypothetical protein VIF57_04565 [Polyangia bacterium]
MAGSDITVEILKDIRDDIRGVRTELRTEIGGLRSEIGSVHAELRQLRTDTNDRFEAVESVLRDLAEQQRFVVHYTKALAERDSRLEGRVSSLESRVEKLETK